MTIKIPGTTVLKDEQGRARGLLEFNTGRLLDMSGKFTGQTLEAHGPSQDDPYPENGDALMSDVAGRYYYSHVCASTGRKSVTMKDARGEGVQVNMDLAIGDVHIPGTMPNFAGGYKLAGGIADIASPVIVVPKQSDYYFIWDSANAFKRVIPNTSSPGGSVGEVNPTLSKTQFTAIEYALGAYVPTEIEANADAPLRPYQAAVMRVMNALRLEREFRVSTLLATAANWNANNAIALGGTANWNGGSTSDPVANMHSIEEKSFAEISRWVFSEIGYHAFVRNPAVRAYWATGTSNPVIPSPEQISALLKIAPITLARMKYAGASGAPTYVWPSAAGSLSAAVALHEPPQNPPTSQEDVASTYTFRWGAAPAPDGTVTAGFMVRSYYDPKRGGRGGRVVVVVHNDTEVMTSNIVGGCITGIIQ